MELAKLERKKDIYEKAGVKEYWIVAPQGKSVEIYYLENGNISWSRVLSCRTTRRKTIIMWTRKSA